MKGFFLFCVFVYLHVSQAQHLYAQNATRGSVPVYVMMPLDTVNNDNTLNNPGKIEYQLQQLKFAGVDGIMVDVWWGIVEKSPQSYNFGGYKELFELCKSIGLKVQVVMSFHQCGGNVGDTCDIPIPSWVQSIGDGIFYKDQHGNVNREYISLFADQEPLFGGRTPIDIYRDFMAAFVKDLASFIGPVVFEAQIGLGPAGELRYPSYPLSKWSFCGVGEFQCYDDFAKKVLADAAKASGHPEWGSAGPSNAGSYNDKPFSTGFFGQGNDNFKSEYGRFFQKWYFDNLLAHGDRVLEAAAKVLKPAGMKIAAKVAGIHWWVLDESRAAEMTAGYYMNNGNDGYGQIARMFARHGVIFDFTCLEMKNEEQPSECKCGPNDIVEATKKAAFAANIGYAGENALPRYDGVAYDTIKNNAKKFGLMEGFTYLRLNENLLNNANFDTFRSFVSDMHKL